jgi:hypothetical protein
LRPFLMMFALWQTLHVCFIVIWIMGL